MSVKSRLKNLEWLMKAYKKLNYYKYAALTLISPELNTKMRYKKAFGTKPDLKTPKTFNEKLLWLKLNKYNKDPLVIRCADKYRVREYVKECDCEDILVELLGAYDKACEIPWEELPDEFVLKWNFGANMNVICRDKSHISKSKVISDLNTWEKDKKCWLSYSEMQYKYIERKIICEELLAQKDTDTGSIPDYKVYCFEGEPLAILVMHDRDNGVKSEFFDVCWNLLESDNKYAAPSKKTECPVCLEKMLRCSRALSKPFPFVRCDYYVVNDNLYFGELTFTPAGGIHTSSCKIDGKDMGDYLNLT